MSGPGDDLADVRRGYRRGALERADLPPDHLADPLAAVRAWVDEAVTEDNEVEPTAMTLATIGEDRAGPLPDARVVLCKGIDHGLVFYTSRGSAKGQQLAASPVAAAVFLWATMERQVRVRGRVEVVDDATSDAYFASRPRESQVGAWASSQSDVVEDRDALDAQRAAIETRFAGRDVPRPSTWGGYRLVPDEVELWQGRPGRLHDRLRWQRHGDGWVVDRLQP